MSAARGACELESKSDPADAPGEPSEDTFTGGQWAQGDITIAAAVGCGRQRCARVRQRFLREGLEGLRRDAPRSGRPSKHDAQRIVTLTTTTRPAQAADWSRTLMAQAAGVSPSTVGRVWRRHGLKPHRIATFKVSRDAQIAEKLEAIAGLYLAPPEHALVLCVDEPRCRR